MKVYRGIVASNMDLNRRGTVWATVPELHETVPVEYMSPLMNMDAGFFAPPTPGSEILILYLETTGGKEGGYYYLGSLSSRRFMSDFIESSIFEGEDWISDIGGAKKVSLPGPARPEGSSSVRFPNLPPDFQNAYANEVTPSKMGMLDKGRSGIVMINQKKGGDGAWFNVTTRLQSGTGKKIELFDTPELDHILITTGKDENNVEDCVKLVGAQNSVGAEGNILESGEFNVTSRGPTKILSKGNGIELRTGDAGLNIDIINNSDGFLAPSPNARRMTGLGGGDAELRLSDEIEEDWQGQQITVPTIEGDALRDKWKIPLPLASTFSAGQTHPDLAKTLPEGFNPLDKANEDWGCVNIKSKWNNINLETEAVDGVIHINAPGPLTKVVVTTGGTVDIIATGKISLTSDTKIELNAPHVDINTPKAHPMAPGELGRVDID